MLKKTLTTGLLSLGLPVALAFTGVGTASAQDVPQLAGADLERANLIYFQRCAGCHGTLRKGATGPNLLPETTQELGQRRLERIISLGTEGGMNNFDGILTQDEIHD
jgi:nitrite reductase (NO-forming) / hydroxylamine reductase